MVFLQKHHRGTVGASATLRVSTRALILSRWCKSIGKNVLKIEK